MHQSRKPALFLKGIEKIIFDMDGVITSEQNYWSAAALTVYEMFYSNQYYGDCTIKTNLVEEEVFNIRREIFLADKTINLLKNRGANSNWDLAYAVLCAVLLIRETESVKDIEASTFWQKVYMYFVEQKLEIYELLDFMAEQLVKLYKKDWQYFCRNGELWNVCKNVFQEWVLGDKIYYEAYKKEPSLSGKKGLMYSEQPIFPLDELEEVLKTLSNAGIILGVGTGRPFVEIEQPLISWDLKKYFSEDAFITYNEVMNAEKTFKAEKSQNINLAKPHPYMFLKAIYGKDYSDYDLLMGNYDKKQIEKVLIIGDAGADIMAAKAINCKFAAVLTGIAGEKGREYFEKMKAEYILKDIRELIV